MHDDTTPAEAAEVYELDVLRAASKAIFGVEREVLDGAARLRGLSGALTKEAVAAAIEAFMAHPV